jgi:hypothetical protein
MAKAFTSLLMGLAACAWVNFAAGAASVSCKDCSTDTAQTQDLRSESKSKLIERARRIVLLKSPPIALGTVRILARSSDYLPPR